MENRFKLRISRMFRASFGSCRSRNVTDVIGKAVFVPESRRDFHLIEPLYPKIQTFPAMCRPRRPETMDISGNDCIEGKEILNRRKVSERSVCFVSGDIEGRKCPPTSPISPFNSFCKFQDCRTKERKKKLSKKKNKKKETNGWFSSEEEIEDGTDGGWFSSEDEIEDGTETFFSSKSFSSDSSELHRRKKKSSRRKIDETRRKKTVRRNYEMGLCPIVTNGMVRESFAVVKRSSDPHNDFRTSMVEMIIEKQIFAAKDLEQLLQCFLTLNSYHHHSIIVEVFTEIWEALFSNWS